MTNDWIPSVDELRTVSGNAGPGKCWEAIRALVASRVPKVREEIAAAYDRGFTQGQKFTPARESVDVEPSISEMRAAYYKAIGSSTVNGSSPTPSLDAGMAALRSLCRSRTTAPPRDSSPAASGEVETARDIMDRHVSAAMHEKYAGLEAAAEKKVREIVRAETRIFDMCIGILDQRVSKLEVARDSSAAESAPISTDEGEMKACPCGAKAMDHVYGDEDKGFFYECWAPASECRWKAYGDTPEEARAAWNRRAPAPEAERPPLAPCEPSAEPSLEEVERVFVEVSGLTIGHSGEVQDGWGYAREGLAAVRALFVKEKLT